MARSLGPQSNKIPCLFPIMSSIWMSSLEGLDLRACWPEAASHSAPQASALGGPLTWPLRKVPKSWCTISFHHSVAWYTQDILVALCVSFLSYPHVLFSPLLHHFPCLSSPSPSIPNNNHPSLSPLDCAVHEDQKSDFFLIILSTAQLAISIWSSLKTRLKAQKAVFKGQPHRSPEPAVIRQDHQVAQTTYCVSLGPGFG